MAQKRSLRYGLLAGTLMLVSSLLTTPAAPATAMSNAKGEAALVSENASGILPPVFPASAPSQVAAPESGLAPVVVQAERWDTSPDLRTLGGVNARAEPSLEPPLEIFNPILPKALPKGPAAAKQPAQTDQPLQAPVPALDLPVQSTSSMPEPLLNFDGVANLFGGWPPDTQGDIGPGHYIQWINLHFAIWQIDKVQHTAALVYGPVAGNTLFAGFGGPCQTTNNGDPITLYDPFSDRWLMSQFALPYYPSGPFYQCVAVSATNDPTAAWHRYQFEDPFNKMNDYPKFGVWPNAYYLTINQFAGGSLGWAGAGVMALERQAMVNGQPARLVYFDLAQVNSSFGGLLPADFDGLTLPPDGAPGYFAEWDDSTWIGPQDALRIWEFQVDWSAPENATFGLSGQPNWVIPTREVDPSMCDMSRSCIPQPGTTRKVDAISDRLMYRLQYRNFGGYAALVTNHTVDYDGTDRAGIHWFELRKQALGTDWQVYQEGVFSPDANQRWMGSLAMDHVGDIALGYSVSSSTVYPSVRYTGRLAGDAPGSLPQGEIVLVEGSGSQTGSSRWGDYSMLGLDPTDDCTFWYTQQYVKTTGYNTWTTRIGAFRFPGCTVGPQGSLRGRVTSVLTGEPLVGAQVSATLSPTQTLTTHTNAAGDYLIVAPVGIYTVTASLFRYVAQQVTGLEISEAGETIQDFVLATSPTHRVTGVVRDHSTGWPLYAKITPQVSGAAPVWTDPVGGAYSLEMPEGFDFTLQAEAYQTGYVSQEVPIPALTEDVIVDIDLQVDPMSCSVPGYSPMLTGLFSSDFEADNGGLITATLSGANSWGWGAIVSGPGQAASGLKGWATNPSGEYLNNENSTLTLPPLDLSAYPGQLPALRWKQFLVTEARYDFARIEVSTQGAGGPWTAIYGPLSGTIDDKWTEHTLLLDPEFAVSNLLIRFRFTSDVSLTFTGWYIDDLTVGVGSCDPSDGGLVAGFVRDGNTGSGLVGALIRDSQGASTLSVATPDDPAAGDGLYQLYSPHASHVFTATYGLFYQPDAETVSVPSGGTVGQDFDLPAPLLNVEPDRLAVSLELGQTITRSLTITNNGGASLAYELLELKGGLLQPGTIEEPQAVVKSFKGDMLDTQTLGLPAGPTAPQIEGGQVIASWSPAGLTGAWGVAYDPLDETVWVSSPSAAWSGIDRLAEFFPDGTPTSRILPHTSPHTSGPADLAYNWNTGKFWIMNVNTGVDNCIHEIDPDLGYTGRKICPETGIGFTNSQRGLAYDPDTDTWISGSWNDLMIHRFDSEGNILESVNTGLSISGLAYNPLTKHLFVMTNASTSYVYVLDAGNGYQLLGRFAPSQGFPANAGAGMELDCQGNLWAVDLKEGKVSQFASGETTAVCQQDIPWLSTQPTAGVIEAGLSQLVTVTFSAARPVIDQPGVFAAQLKLKENTPYPVNNLPLTMTVTAPASFGLLKGVASGLGYCDLDPAPLDGALLELTSSQGATETTTTGSTGGYQRWLDETGSPYTLTLSAPGYSSVVSGIMVSRGLTTTLDLSLPLLEPCVKSDPTYLAPVLKFGRVITRTIELQNLGHQDTPYTWHEAEKNTPEVFTDLDFLSVAAGSGSLIAQADPITATVTFTAETPTVTAPGTYYANLVLETDDPLNSLITLPITMTVLPLDYGVAITAPVPTAQGVPGQQLSIPFLVTNTSEGPVDSFLLSRSAPAWQTYLAPEQVGPLQIGASAAADLIVTIPDTSMPGEGQMITVTAASQADPTKTDSASTLIQVIQPLADLELSVTASPEPHWVYQPLTYTVAITNHGPTAASNVVFVDVLSPKLQYLSDSAGEAGVPGCTLENSVLSCQLGWLDSGGLRSFFIRLLPVRPGLGISQSAVTSQSLDPDLGNNIVSTVGVFPGWVYYYPWVEVR